MKWRTAIAPSATAKTIPPTTNSAPGRKTLDSAGISGATLGLLLGASSAAAVIRATG